MHLPVGLIQFKADEQLEIGCGVATRGRAGTACASGRVERAPLSRKLITRAFLVRNADFEFIVHPHLAGRLLPAGLLEIHHRRPVRDRNRQMATDDDGRYHDVSPTSRNEQARRLYASLGFVEYGTEKNALKQNGRYYDEVLMAKDLSEESH